MKELSEEQIERQDYVDNAIYELIKQVNPTNKQIEWDIELIGEIRDSIRECLVQKLRITDEQDFYPFLED